MRKLNMPERTSTRERKPMQPRPILPCAVCGKLFVASTRWGRLERYCSKTCSGIDHRRPFDKERVLRTVIKTDDGCWLWNRSGNYCCAWINGKVSSVHRAVYELFKGPIPNGLEVCHECDNPPCCNPDHLFLGTQTDNMTDCASKDRVKTPSRHGRIPDAKLAEIRSLHAEGLTYAQIAERFGIHRSTAFNICRHKRHWTHR